MNPKEELERELFLILIEECETECLGEMLLEPRPSIMPYESIH